MFYPLFTTALLATSFYTQNFVRTGRSWTNPRGANLLEGTANVATPAVERLFASGVVPLEQTATGALVEAQRLVFPAVKMTTLATTALVDTVASNAHSIYQAVNDYAISKNEVAATSVAVNSTQVTSGQFDDLPPLVEAEEKPAKRHPRYAVMYNGEFSLSVAIMRGDPDLLKLHIDDGADVNGRSRFSGIPHISEAVLMNSQTSEEIVRILLESGVDPNVKDKDDGATPLSHALRRREEKHVKLLVQHGADVNDKYNDGSTPLIDAVDWADESIVKLLLDKGADVNAKDKDGNTPIIHAARRGNEAVINLLLERGADASVINSFGISALDTAVAGKKKSVVEQFKKAATHTERAAALKDEGKGSRKR